MATTSADYNFRDIEPHWQAFWEANGLFKAEVFGFVVVLVCCNIGLNTRGGPREIGASVTRAVVTSLILILELDYFLTQVLM